MTHQINLNLRHEADNTSSASGRIVSNPATGISTTSILDDPVATKSNTSASVDTIDMVEGVCNVFLPYTRFLGFPEFSGYHQWQQESQ